VVCKAYDDTNRQVLLKLGANKVLIPEQEQASRLARSLSSANVLDYIELSDAYGIMEVPAPTSWIGKSLKDLNVRAKLGVNIIAIKQGDNINVSPRADYEIMPGDIMEIIGDSDALTAVQKL
jgi:trk system potassium uptake protein TrkA